MDEYIKRESAIEAIMSDPPDAHYQSWYAEKIKAIPADDVDPFRYGRWKCHGDCGVTECSVCGWSIEEYVGDYAYCPNCGAKMDGDDHA